MRALKTAAIIALIVVGSLAIGFGVSWILGHILGRMIGIFGDPTTVPTHHH